MVAEKQTESISFDSARKRFLERRHLIKCGGALISGALFCPSILSAQTNHFDGARKINLSGRQRMLIQRAGKLVTLSYLASNRRPFLAEAEKALELHQRTAVALRDGDDSLGLEPETNISVLNALDSAYNAFSPYGEAIRNAIENHAANYESLQKIAALNGYALEEMDMAVSIIERVYKSRALTEQMAMLINISGRQRMFTQRMILLLCLTRTEITSDSLRQEIFITMNRFSISLNILERVTPVAIKNQSLDPIVQGINSAQSEWDSLKALISTALCPRKKQSIDDILHADKRAEALMLQMNELVLLYEKAA